ALYQEGLLDTKGFNQTDQMRTMVDEKSAPIYGAIFGPTPYNVLIEAQVEQYEMLMPFYSEGGKQIYRDLIGPVIGGTFAISSQCEDPATLLNWVDYLYTQPGAVLAMIGEEEEDYILSEDGKWSVLQNASGNMAGTNNSIAGNGYFPWLSPVEFELSIKDEKGYQSLLAIYHLNEIVTFPYPAYRLTNEQWKEIQPLQKALATYVDESLARFVMGEWEITDQQWKDYLNELENLQVRDFVDFWQKTSDNAQ
ncbi:MAG: hypothetical protein GX786_02545, partial [Clostridiales bacterium]|nr:hypothetical protein [Clostridiales bacterium]